MKIFRMKKVRSGRMISAPAERRKTMKRLLLTIPCERGELFYISSGRRVLLASCEAELKIYEHTSRIQAIGGSGVKRIYGVLALCETAELTRPVDDRFLSSVDGFDLSADIQCQNGVFEVFHFRNIQPEEINEGGNWIFSLNEKQELYRRLITI